MLCLRLLSLLLCFFPSYMLAHGWASNSAKGDTAIRFRRNDPYFRHKNVSFYPDLMFDDEATSSTGIQEKVVVRGQVVILECLERDKQIKFQRKIKDTHSDAAVRWLHDDKEVKPDLRVTWSVTGTLRISHAVSSDSGVWRCRKDGYPRRPLRLIVTKRPFLVYGTAQLAEGARLTTRAGNILTLHCIVKGGNPAPTVEWFLNEKEITSNSSTRNEWEGPDEQFTSISNVTIEKVMKSHHNASVVCRVEHPALSRPQTSHLKLNIEYPPDFRLRRQPTWGAPLIDGSSVTLQCHVDANPLSVPMWVKQPETKDEEILPTKDGWLNLTSLSAANRGWYKCITDHKFGHYSSHSVFINVVRPLGGTKSSEAKVGASRIGDDSNMQVYPSESSKVDETEPCSASSGSSSLCWHTEMTQDDEKSAVSQQYPLRQSEQQLLVGQRNFKDCPPYDDNKENNDQSDYIFKSGMKIKVMNRTHAALEGGPAMLTAHICGRAVTANQVTWLPPTKHMPLSPGTTYRRWTAFNLSSPVSQKCVLSHLHIASVVAIRDAGMWVILVTDFFNAQAAVVQLNVTMAKSLPFPTAGSVESKAPQWTSSLLLCVLFSGALVL